MAIVGIDAGTQSLKAVVTSDDLTLLGTATRAYGVDHPRPGWAQQDPHLWAEALAPAIGEALARARVAPSAVAALGVAGQLDGCVAVGESGQPLGPCLIWMDRRADRELPELPPHFRQLTGLTADPGHMAAKIAWLRRHAHGLSRARFHQPVSYLVERLCGEFVMDHGPASSSASPERPRWWAACASARSSIQPGWSRPTATPRPASSSRTRAGYRAAPWPGCAPSSARPTTRSSTDGRRPRRRAR